MVKSPIKKPQTVRERASKSSVTNKTRTINKAGKAALKPLKAVKEIGKKEFYLPLPDNKVGKFLNKRRSAAPSYFVGAWRELKQVNWPGRKETAKLTVAVFIFAIFFGALITVTDYGLDKVFKKLILR